MTHLHLVLSACALVLVPMATAFAARPFVTEDAGVLDQGSCEFEASVGRTSQRGSPRESRWWLQPVCGVGARTQLAIGTGATRGGGLQTRGISLLGKTWLTTPADEGLNVAIAYGTGLSKVPGDRWRQDGRFLNLVGTLRQGASTFGANLGWSRDLIGRQTSTTWSLGWERPVAVGLDAGVDLYGDDREAPWLNLGLRWAVREGLWLDTSVAQQSNAARARSLNLGLRLGW